MLWDYFPIIQWEFATIGHLLCFLIFSFLQWVGMDGTLITKISLCLKSVRVLTIRLEGSAVLECSDLFVLLRRRVHELEL